MAYVGNAQQASGGFKWAGGSCAVSYTMTVDPAGQGSMSGTMCGENISGTF